MKGFIRTIEVVLASFLLVSVLIYMGRGFSDKWDRSGITLEAWSVLNSISENGSIRYALYENNHESYTRLNLLVKSSLPVDASFKIVGFRVAKPNFIVFDTVNISEFLGPNDNVKFANMNSSILYHQDSLSSIINDQSIYSYDILYLKPSSVSGLKSSEYSILMSYIESGGHVVIIGPFSPRRIKDLVGGVYKSSSNTKTFRRGVFDGASLSEIFFNTGGLSKLTFNQQTLRVEGNITLTGVDYSYFLNYDDARGEYCINYSGNCYFEGDVFRVGNENVEVLKIKPGESVYFRIKNAWHRFSSSQVVSITPGLNTSCLMGQNSNCLITFRRIGKGWVMWVFKSQKGTDYSALLRSLPVLANEFYIISPETLEKSYDVRDEMSIASEFARRAEIVEFFGDYPAIIYLYLWPSY